MSQMQGERAGSAPYLPTAATTDPSAAGRAAGRATQRTAAPARREYSVFLEGETVDLCPPMPADVTESRWFDWLNDMETTRYLYSQGIYPNSPERQLRWLDRAMEDPSRIVLLMRPKGSATAIGVVSLSNINLSYRSADIAVVRAARQGKSSPFAVLEAMARLTEHAFERVGVECVRGWSTYPELRRFVQRLELIGYQSEGIIRYGWGRGYRHYETIVGSCVLADYLRIRELRGGRFWPGEALMRELVHELPDKGFVDHIEETLAEKRKEYFGKLRLA